MNAAIKNTAIKNTAIMSTAIRNAIPHLVRVSLFGLALLAAPPAATAEDGTVLRGSMFVSVASGNTISGINKDGVRFHVYFLSGGVATFADENDRIDVGRWRIRPEDDAVCVLWKTITVDELCAIVTMDGGTLLLDGDVPVGEVELMGTIVTDFD